MPDLTVRSIGADRLAQAYPLIRSATRVSQQRWEDFGRWLLSGGGGMLVVTAPDGCVHGVAAYRPSPNLRHERSLDVEVLVAFELRGDDMVREALVSELERIAIERECSAVNFIVDATTIDPSSRARLGLDRLGLKLDTASFVRDVSADAG